MNDTRSPVTMDEIASRLLTHLHRFAADLDGTRLGELMHRLSDHPVIAVCGQELLVSYTGRASDAAGLDRAEAVRWLAALDAGFVGLHHHRDMLGAFLARGMTNPHLELDERRERLMLSDPARVATRDAIVEFRARRAQVIDFAAAVRERRGDDYLALSHDELRSRNLINRADALCLTDHA